MKFDKSVFSISILAGIIILVIAMILLGFFDFGEKIVEVPELPADYYRCGNTLVPFRANISDCEAFPITPDEFSYKQTVLNPLVHNVYILVDPEGTSGLGLSSYELFKTYNSLLINSGVVYTKPVLNQTEVPVMSVENATSTSPIIHLIENSDTNIIQVTNNTVIVQATNQYNMDAAACKLAIIAINTKFDCSFENE